jgi:hypothetical protein
VTLAKLPIRRCRTHWEACRDRTYAGVTAGLEQVYGRAAANRPIALTTRTIWPYHTNMATMTVRATYALDPETVGTLERLARRWGVSKSAALRRAIQAAGGRRGGAD